MVTEAEHMNGDTDYNSKLIENWAQTANRDFNASKKQMEAMQREGKTKKALEARDEMNYNRGLMEGFMLVVTEYKLAEQKEADTRTKKSSRRPPARDTGRIIGSMV